ncbi:hypothetical protein AVEN_220051-1 [Araneus ventricosus]|uniref:Uncharacterized protein n=1 Tax=Araneus ventricosus TaxID=182803 RepID=A0A4Y2CS28_ARAVE|nr:hypothetical protein AVEN_220051-1 [Araneus ventricosus]
MGYLLHPAGRLKQQSCLRCSNNYMWQGCTVSDVKDLGYLVNIICSRDQLNRSIFVGFPIGNKSFGLVLKWRRISRRNRQEVVAKSSGGLRPTQLRQRLGGRVK